MCITGATGALGTILSKSFQNHPQVDLLFLHQRELPCAPSSTTVSLSTSSTKPSPSPSAKLSSSSSSSTQPPPSFEDTFSLPHNSTTSPSLARSYRVSGNFDRREGVADLLSSIRQCVARSSPQVSSSSSPPQSFPTRDAGGTSTPHLSSTYPDSHSSSSTERPLPSSEVDIYIHCARAGTEYNYTTLLSMHLSIISSMNL